ncbi:unnamed protein product [Lasius platythorax]|uniref:Uncharacterized protein n=1 Tax=Lasius platythorax TaxID=488582 RepID=A0AAV2NCA9_9HYME
MSMEQELSQMNIQMKKNKNRFTQKPQDLVELNKLSSECIGFSEMLSAETHDEPQLGTKELKIREYSQLPMTPRQPHQILLQPPVLSLPKNHQSQVNQGH